MNVDNICLSDTCGSLNEEDFEYIVDTCAYFGLPFSKFSLHLHVKREREAEVEKIIQIRRNTRQLQDSLHVKTGQLKIKRIRNLSWTFLTEIFKVLKS